MKRYIYKDIINHLPKQAITLLVGARQVGKTTVLKQVHDYLKAKSDLSFFFSLENKLHVLAADGLFRKSGLFHVMPNIVI